MHFTYAFVVLFFFWESSQALSPCYEDSKLFCGGSTAPISTKTCTAEWGRFPTLIDGTTDLISLRLGHSMTYLLQSLHFNEWKENRPGFHSYFSKLSDEEWDSGINLMLYMIKRGGHLSDNFNVTIDNVDLATKTHPANELESLSWALDLEKLTAHQTLRLSYIATHTSTMAPYNSPPDVAFANFLAESLNDVSVLRIKHLTNYVHMLTQILNPIGGSSVDKAYALFTFDHTILK